MLNIVTKIAPTMIHPCRSRFVMWFPILASDLISEKLRPSVCRHRAAPDVARCGKFNPSHHPKSKSLILSEQLGLPEQPRLRVYLVEQRLGVFQVGSVETLGEPAVDLGEHRARLVPPPLLR